MKVTNDTLNRIQHDINTMLDSMVFGKPITKACAINATLNNVSAIHYLWFKTFVNRMYETSHPMVIKDSNGNRLLERDENYSLYPNETNDTTIETAIKHVLKQILNETV